MNKRILLILSILLVFNITRAAYFEYLPYTVTQPDGKTINCFVSGDEFFNWIHDQDGYTIIQAPDGYYYYAVQNGDSLKPSAFLLNSVNPAKAGLIKWAKISIKEYKRRQDAMYAYRQSGKSGPENAPLTGTMNNIVIYIRFADDSEFSITRQTYEDRLNPSTGVSLKSYYKEVSYDNLTINSTQYPACALTTNLSFQDVHNRNFFQPYNATTNTAGYNNDTEKALREHSLLVAAVTWINSNSPVPGSITVDGDADNNVDNVCFIVRGNSGAWSDLLWAHRWSLYSQTVYINGKRVYGYTFQPENQVTVKTLCHEMFHSLGAPDLYHYTNQGAIAPAGSWDIMDGGSGHMLTYMKWKYTKKIWISSIPQITVTGTYTLNPSTSSTNNCYKIPSPYSADEYFMVEYRNKTGTFEGNLPGSGLIVYRIDTRSLTGNSTGPPDEVYVYRPGGTTTINGTQSNAYFSLTAGRTAINDATNPTSFLQNGSAGGLNISNISAAGATISFVVTLPDPPPPPALVFATNIINTSFTANWTPSATATGYKIDISTNPGFTSFIPLYENRDVRNIFQEIFGLNPKTQYYFRVKAYNTGGSGLPSGTVSVFTLTTPSSTPTEMTASSCNNLVTLKWKESFGPDFVRYRIYRKTPLGQFTKVDSTTNGVSETLKVISGLVKGDTWIFSVTAINYDGSESYYSEAQMITVKPGVIPKIKVKWNDVLICYNLGDSIRNYQWYNSTGKITGETNQFYKTDKTAGAFHVETIDSEGCKNSSTEISMPGSGSKSLSVYPNPASVSFSLKIDDESEGNVVISIFNTYGAKVMELQSEKRGGEILKEIPVTNLPDGLYRVMVSINKKDIYSSIIVVSKR